MENMEKGLHVPKWVLINQPKIPQMPQNLSAQIVSQSPKAWDFDEKRLHWASVVRAWNNGSVNYQKKKCFTYLCRRPLPKALQLWPLSWPQLTPPNNRVSLLPPPRVISTITNYQLMVPHFSNSLSGKPPMVTPLFHPQLHYFTTNPMSFKTVIWFLLLHNLTNH